MKLNLCDPDVIASLLEIYDASETACAFVEYVACVANDYTNYENIQRCAALLRDAMNNDSE